MRKNKELALSLIFDKIREDKQITYLDIQQLTGYSKRQLIRLSKKLINEKDMDDILHHANEGRIPVNKASNNEIEFICEFKTPYPNITISQFMDIYNEDVINNPDYKDIVMKLNLKHRSKSFFQVLFKKQGWKSSIKRKVKRIGRKHHNLRNPSPQRGLLIQIDGTPYDWFDNGELWTLHLAVDDSSSEVLAGWFLPTERQLGYCIIMKMILEQYGIPMALYSDKHTIFCNIKDDSKTQFGLMMETLGIEMVFANTSQAKGRVERYNYTVQNRLPNDIIRFSINDYDELNIWFNNFYKNYLNKKFSFNPIDPNDAFIPLYDTNLSNIFYQRYKRTIRNDVFSFNNKYYSLIDENGEVVHIINGTIIELRIDVFTNEMYIIRYGIKYTALLVSERVHKQKDILNNQKDVLEFIHFLRLSSSKHNR